MADLDLYLWDFLPAEPAADSLQAKFEAWIAANPAVFDEFRAAALRLAKVRKHFGSKLIVEEMRHWSGVHTTGDAYRFNNNWTSRLTRKLLAEHPELEPFIELRRLQRD